MSDMISGGANAKSWLAISSHMACTSEYLHTSVVTTKSTFSMLWIVFWEWGHTKVRNTDGRSAAR